MFNKERYISGTTCPKKAWMETNRPELFTTEVADSKNDGLAQAFQYADEYYKDSFGSYKRVASSDVLEATSETQKLIQEGEQNIKDAIFIHNGAFCRFSFLRNIGDSHVEVYMTKLKNSVYNSKSETLKKEYKKEAEYNLCILEQCGYTVDKVAYVVFDSLYIKNGEIDAPHLFKVVDVTKQVISDNSAVGCKILEIQNVLKLKEEPFEAIDDSVCQLTSCPYWEYCSSQIPNLPENNIFDIKGNDFSKKAKLTLYREGRLSYDAALEAAGIFKNGSKVPMVLTNEANRSFYINRAEINAFLDNVTYPAYFLDFESVEYALPRYDQSHTYQKICFQYSLHVILEEGGEIDHREYLGKPGEDPRRALCEQLCEDIPAGACVIAYHAGFETDRIKEMAEIFPDLKEHLMSMADHIVDIEKPFSDKSYYCSGFKGSSSIKVVLPTLFPDDPELDYHNLQGIHRGDEAAQAFIDMETMSEEEAAVCSDNLKKYCRLDTLAMVKVLEALKKL